MPRTRINGAVTLTLTLNAIDCAECGVVFAVTDEFEQKRRSDNAVFYCPNGHTLGYGETELDRVRKRLREEQNRAAAIRAEADQAWAAAQAAAKDLTSAHRSIGQLKRRAAAGVCPCCHRTVKELAEHVANKHPEFAKEHLGRVPVARKRREEVTTT